VYKTFPSRPTACCWLIFSGGAGCGGCLSRFQVVTRPCPPPGHIKSRLNARRGDREHLGNFLVIFPSHYVAPLRPLYVRVCGWMYRRFDRKNTSGKKRRIYINVFDAIREGVERRKVKVKNSTRSVGRLGEHEQRERKTLSTAAYAFDSARKKKPKIIRISVN